MAQKVDVTANLRLRLPEPLRAKLAEMAQANDRSLNSEILWALVQHAGEAWIRANLLDLPMDILQQAVTKLQEENRRLREEKGFGPDDEIPEPKATEPGAPKIRRRF